MVGIECKKTILISLEKAISKKKPIDKKLYDISEIISNY